MMRRVWRKMLSVRCRCIKLLVPRSKCLNYSFHVNYAKVKIQVPHLETSFNAYFLVCLNVSFGIL